MSDSSSRPTLRDLPLPAKLVISAFLISVGLGYCWALLQLHFKHASKGNLAPTAEDVVARFSGKPLPWAKEEANAAENAPAPQAEPKRDADPRRIDRRGDKDPEPKKAAGKMVAAIKIKSLMDYRCALCHIKDEEQEDHPLDTYANIQKMLGDPPQKGGIHKAIRNEDESGFGKESMAQAFTTKSNTKINNMEVNWKAAIKLRPEEELRAERRTERLAMIAWLEAGAPEDAYKNDAFALPEELRGKPLTSDFKTEAPEPTREERDAAAGAARRKKPPDQCQISVGDLTQSTHAHLLTFSLLWAATGLVFAFTSFPYVLRVTLAPMVLVAQVIDIGCWWLARLPDVGPYFALAIMGTGAIVGLGVALQIVLSLFNMYGGKGKFILLVLLVLSAGGGGIVYSKYVAPMIEEEKKAAAK